MVQSMCMRSYLAPYIEYIPSEGLSLIGCTAAEDQ